MFDYSMIIPLTHDCILSCSVKLNINAQFFKRCYWINKFVYGFGMYLTYRF